MSKHRQHSDQHDTPHDANDSTDRTREQPAIPPRSVHKTGRLMPGAQAQQQEQERAARLAREQQEAREARERETRLAHLFAASIRQRAEERHRAVWAAMDTGPLLQLLWPRPTPIPQPRVPTGTLGNPADLLLTRVPAPGEPLLRFHLHERVYYAVAGQTMLARVEGWRRFSTGYHYIVRDSVERKHPQLGRVLEWAATTTEVWQDCLTSDEQRVRTLGGRRRIRPRRTMPLLPPPSTPSTP